MSHGKVTSLSFKLFIYVGLLTSCVQSLVARGDFRTHDRVYRTVPLQRSVVSAPG